MVFSAVTENRTVLPGYTFGERIARNHRAGSVGGAGGAEASLGVIEVIKSAVVLPAGSVSPMSPLDFRMSGVVTLNFEKRATLEIPDTTCASRPVPADGIFEDKRTFTVCIRRFADAILSGGTLTRSAADWTRRNVPC